MGYMNETHVLNRIAAETAEWIATELLATAEREPMASARYRSAATTIRAQAANYRARAHRAGHLAPAV
jgi:hypothetical protein